MSKYSSNHIERLCEYAHEANRIYCESIGDRSQKPWHLAEQWQRSATRAGVLHAIDYPASGPQQSHAAWSKEKLDAGWKYGPIKDAEKKEHPCLVAYEDLPEEQRLKDVIFQTMVRAGVAIIEHRLAEHQKEADLIVDSALKLTTPEDTGEFMNPTLQPDESGLIPIGKNAWVTQEVVDQLLAYGSPPEPKE